MPRIIELKEAAERFGVGPKRLRQMVRADEDFPGAFRKNARGDLAFYDSAAFRLRAAQKKSAKEASRDNQAWKAGERPRPPEVPKGLADALLSGFFSDLPGVKVTWTDIDVSGVPESARAAVMNALGKRLQFITKGKDWWLGDTMVKARDFGQTIPFNQMKEHGQKMAAASFYPHSERRSELSFHHHVEAMRGANGNLALALSRLDLAQQKNWSANALRAHIRRAAELSAAAE